MNSYAEGDTDMLMRGNRFYAMRKYFGEAL
jgi:hypothetical protein